MLDSFEILSTSGVVLWSKSYVPVSASIVNGFIKDVFIEEKVLPGASVADDATAAKNPAYKREKYTLKWTSVKDLGLIFVVGVVAGPFEQNFANRTIIVGSVPIATASLMDRQSVGQHQSHIRGSIPRSAQETPY
jgi:hypothetical protein